MSALLAVALFLAALTAALDCQCAGASSLESTWTQGSGLRKSPGVKALESALTTGPGARQAAELSRSLLSNRSSTISPYDESLARLTITLLSPSVRGALDAVDSRRELTRAQDKALRRAVKAIVRNQAVHQLEARGARLKRSPAKLRRAVSALTEGLSALKPGAGNQAADPSASGSAENPFLEMERNLSDPAQGVHGESLAAALQELLTAPGALRYFRSWSPFSLAVFLDQPPTRPSLNRVALSSREDDADPDCTIAETQAMIYVASSVGKAVTDWAIDRLTGTTRLGSARMPSGRALQKTLNKHLGRQEPGWTRVLSYMPFLKQGDQVGKSVMAARYWAAVRCYAERVQLVPSKMKRAAGEHQLYNLLAFNAKGREIAAVPPDWMRIDDGECVEGYPDWDCSSTVAGPHALLARFGDLPPAAGTLTVTPGPLAALDLQPRRSDAGIEAGVNERTVRFSVSGVDEFGNETPAAIGPLSDEVHLSISPEGKCDYSYANCTAYEPGPHEVTASFHDSHRAVVSVEVHPNKLNLRPATVRVPVGQPQQYEADEWTWGGRLLRANVPFGTAGNQAHLTLDPPQVGSCNDGTATCVVDHPDGPGTRAYLVRATTEGGHAVGSAVLEAEENPIIKWSGQVTVKVTARWEWGAAEPSWTDTLESEASLAIDTAAPFEQTETVSHSKNRDSVFDTGTAHWLGYTGTFKGFFNHIAGPTYPSCYWFHRDWDAVGSASLPLPASFNSKELAAGLGILPFPTYFIAFVSGPLIDTTTMQRSPYVCSGPPTEVESEAEWWRVFPDWDEGFMTLSRCSQPGPVKTPDGILHEWGAYGLRSNEPLARIGDRVVGTVSCSTTSPPQDYPKESTALIELDLTARCISGGVPDEKWRCGG